MCLLACVSWCVLVVMVCTCWLVCHGVYLLSWCVLVGLCVMVCTCVGLACVYLLACVLYTHTMHFRHGVQLAMISTASNTNTN